MTKFMVLYNAETSASQTMANSTPEEMKASMNEWIKWHDEANKTAKVEFGLPMEAVGRITTEGVTDSDSSVSGYAIVEAESKTAALELLKNHPHLKRPYSSIDVLEMLAMPGLETN